MASFTRICINYVILPGVVAYGLMNVFKPSNEEIEKVKRFTYGPEYAAYGKVLKAAGDPNSKPIYRQKPGEQHPLPELANQHQPK